MEPETWLWCRLPFGPGRTISSMRRIWWFSLFVLVLSACPPTIDTGDGGDGPLVIGPEGGIFIRPGIGIEVPRGAVDSETTLIVTIVDSDIPEVPERTRVSFGYRISPQTLKLKQQITLHLPWLDERVPKGVDPGSFDMRRRTSTEAYAQLSGARTNTDPVKEVQANTDKLGLFWVTSPTQANVARLELDPTEATMRVGDTKPFTAQVIDPSGQPLDVPVSFTVAPPRVGVMDGGVFIALDPGSATITASAANQTATATVHVQGTTVGPSTFVHENPFPTGNDLHGGVVAPGGLGTVFVGGNATVLARTSAGAWSRLFSSPGVTLKAAGGTTIDDAVAVGTVGTSGVLVQLKGASASPAAMVFDPRQISDLDALAFDGTFGMAVGEGNDVMLYKNGTWVHEANPSFEKLLAIIGDGAGGFVVVGNLGSLYRYDPALGVWNSLYQTRLSVLLTAAALVDPATPQAWAIGGQQLWHFQAGAWTAMPLPLTPKLDEVTALGLFDGRVVITGRTGTAGTILMHDPSGQAVDGGAAVPWTSYATRRRMIPRGVFGGGASSGVGWVVGDLGLVEEWTNGSFTELSKGFLGDVFDLVAVGSDVILTENECLDDACLAQEGHVMHLGASGGGLEPLGPQAFGGALYGIVAKAPNDVVVATSTGLSHWDGTTWTRLGVTSLMGPIYDLAVCGARFYGAGKGGAWYQGTWPNLAYGGSLVQQSSDLHALFCRDESELWVAGDGMMASRTGTDPWNPKTSQSVRPGPWRAVWSPGPGEGFAFGDSNYGVYWDTAQLNALQQLGGLSVDVVEGLWGSSIDNLYAVGLTNPPVKGGFALRFDGLNWTPVDPGSQRRVTVIHGSSATNIWLGTEGGGVLKAVAP